MFLAKERNKTIRRNGDMALRVNTMTVKQFPDALNARRGLLFLRELQRGMTNDRPCIVIDCSNLHQMDRCAIDLLLCCLEEAMKRNGDVKLTTVSEAARATLELTGVGRLFEIYDTNADVLSGSHHLPVDPALYRTAPDRSNRIHGTAA
jgi:anti-sigma B factor antagonist